MENNYIKYPLYLTATVVAILLSLNFIPEGITQKLGMRKIDILSDVRKDTLTVADKNEPLLFPPPPPPKKDIPCPMGMVCFEDFSADNNGLDNFYKALDKVKEGKTIRIAFFGDSYIEGDIFSGDLRHFLQNEFGGSGAGFMPATSQVAGFRQTVKHNFGGWRSYSILDQNKSYSKMGISGNYFMPDGNAWVKYSGVKRPHLDVFHQASIIYSLPEGKATVSYKINDSKETQTAELPVSAKLTRFDINDSIREIQLNFSSSNLYLYGVSLQDKTGVIVDNFSLRGTPGTTLKYLPEDILKQTDELLGYDLIILQYGLNVMSAKQTKYTTYQKGMEETVNHLKESFPNTSILLLSVGDRSMRSADGYSTMPGVPALVSYQQAICAETGIVFWNLYEAMGGSGSMVNMVNSRPPRANKDYTHLNFEGGRYLGEILYNTIMFEKERYDKLRKNRRPKKPQNM